MANLTPRQIVDELNKHIIGQDDAKRAVAIALRNRYRRSRLPEEMRDEITPKNIIMSGPTGVGKTEIARRLSKLMKAPFVKVEATKFTEVGYVGRDVESMVRDLVEASIRMVKQDRIDMVQENAKKAAEERIIDILLDPDSEVSAQPMNNIAALFAPPKPAKVETEEEKQELVTGVYVLVGQQAEFKPVTILAQLEDFALVKSADGSDGKKALRAGDEVILSSVELFDGKVITQS